MKSSPTLTAMLLSAALLSGCGESVPTETSWKEEVLLSDGTRIWVRRTVVGEAYTELGGISAYEVSNRTVEVINAPGLGKPPVWSAKWRTLVWTGTRTGFGISW